MRLSRRAATSSSCPPLSPESSRKKCEIVSKLFEFETADLEELLAADPLAILRLGATAAERDALLETDLTDSLLACLPIHARIDGTTGDASAVFRATAEWPIPLSMEAHVQVVRPCLSARALDRQRRIVKAWTPESQIETALGLPQPHLWRGEILQGLAAVQEARQINHLLLKMRRTPWLTAEAAPIAPEYVLALPPNVDEAARSTLFKEGDAPTFSTAQKLAIDIRDSAGFERLRDWVLPTSGQSFQALAMMISDQGIVGRLGSSEEYPVDDFGVLAIAGRDLRLPGWPLLAAVLTSVNEEETVRPTLIDAFACPDPSDFRMATDHLKCLATLAADNGRSGEAARRAYFRGFAAIAKWNEDVRRLVFAATPVPTENGGWRIGREVVQDGEGVHPSYVLARTCAWSLRTNSAQEDGRAGAGAGPRNADTSFQAPRNFNLVDTARLKSEAAEQHRSFLQPWRGHIPSDLAIIYLGLIGRGAPFGQLANEWRADATTDPETLWAELDQRFTKQILYPNSLGEEIGQRCIFIKTVTGDAVRVVSISGEVFDAPLNSAAEGLIVGNLHKTSQVFRANDGTTRDLMTLAVRRIRPGDLEQNRVSLLFCEFVQSVAMDCLLLVTAAQQEALRNILDKAIHIDQSTLEETELLLRDRLPTNSGRAQAAERVAHTKRPARLPGGGRTPPSSIWQGVGNGGAQAQALARGLEPCGRC